MSNNKFLFYIEFDHNIVTNVLYNVKQNIQLIFRCTATLLHVLCLAFIIFAVSGYASRGL